MGVRFPKDYIDFVANFGEGSIEETLWVTIPTVNTDPMKRRVDRLPEEVIDFPEANEWADPSDEQKYRLEDLLIWGETIEADVLAWITTPSAPEKNGRWPYSLAAQQLGPFSTAA
ncbi:hypothetical protein GCM10020254_83200 [Streptomyces goshikiensis]